MSAYVCVCLRKSASNHGFVRLRKLGQIVLASRGLKEELEPRWNSQPCTKTVRAWLGLSRGCRGCRVLARSQFVFDPCRPRGTARMEGVTACNTATLAILSHT